MGRELGITSKFPEGTVEITPVEDVKKATAGKESAAPSGWPRLLISLARITLGVPILRGRVAQAVPERVSFAIVAEPLGSLRGPLPRA